jgi:hypothetical protein
MIPEELRDADWYAVMDDWVSDGYWAIHRSRFSPSTKPLFDVVRTMVPTTTEIRVLTSGDRDTLVAALPDAKAVLLERTNWGYNPWNYRGEVEGIVFLSKNGRQWAFVQRRYVDAFAVKSLYAKKTKGLTLTVLVDLNRHVALMPVKYECIVPPGAKP